MTSEMGEMFNAARKAGKARRASNRETSPDILRKRDGRWPTTCLRIATR